MTNPNDSVYPYAWKEGDNEAKTAIVNTNPPQLTKREYFAAMAMQSILRYGFDNAMGKGMFDAIARDSITAADALITALNDKP